MCGLEDRLYVGVVGPRPQKQGEGRNNDLWQRMMKEAHHVDDFEQLLDRAETLNAEYLDAMQSAEVANIAKSAWGYTERGQNRFGQHGAWFPTAEANELIKTAQDEFYLLAFLARSTRRTTPLWSPTVSPRHWGGGGNVSAEARQSLIELGCLQQMRQGHHTPDPLSIAGSPSIALGKEQEGVSSENRCPILDSPLLGPRQNIAKLPELL